MECRDALDMRLIFQRRGDTLEFHFYGTHSEVKAFFRNRR
jgi:mRNA-degrading endonuclease YafQ of YafQ-DinJ toxin-antitoxin module